MPNRLPPPRDFNWARTLRTLSFWALLIVGAVALLQFAQNRRQEPDISFTQFTEQLEAGNIDSVEITERQQIKGYLKRGVPSKSGRQYDQFTTLLPFESSDAWVATLREKGVKLRAREEKQSFGVFLFSFLPYLFILGLIIFMLRQMQQGGNRAFAFGKSKAKLLSGDTPKVTFADVAGCDEAKQELEEIIDFLKDPQKFQRLGGRLPKGALLVGPPGTGKTLLAKAVAGEAGRPFFSMSGSDFVEMFVGVGASRVRDLFEQGKAHAPCIIFIDEIDAVGRHRGAGLGGGHRNKSAVDMQDFEDAKDKVMLGLERKSRVLSDEERRLVAYHEAGHALVGLTVPDADPLHKVTIIPRGRALGLTAYLPEEELHKYTKRSIESRLAMAYGGRVAEELVSGPEKVTTGAAQDIQQATNIARRMVTQFGMSAVIGPIAVGDREQEIFLGREVVQRREISDRTAQIVDEEVKNILTRAYADATRIVTERRAALDRLAAALLERETLEREQVEMVIAGQSLPPYVPPPAPAPRTEGGEAEKERARGERPSGGILRNPPPEPAGA